MGVKCCKCNEKHKENEVFIPEEIKYNIFELNKINNRNLKNNNLMSSENDQDLNSNSSLGYGANRRYDSFDNISFENKFHKNTMMSSKTPFLCQITEKDDEYNSNNDEAYSDIEKISVNNILDRIDNIHNHTTNNKNNINNK